MYQPIRGKVSCQSQGQLAMKIAGPRMAIEIIHQGRTEMRRDTRRPRARSARMPRLIQTKWIRKMPGRIQALCLVASASP